jgi:threonyl-tRNA synthetase
VVVPIGEKSEGYARSVEQALRKRGVRVACDSRNEKMQAKIRDAQLQQVPYMAIVGEREAKASTVAARHRREGDLGSLSLETFAERVTQEGKPS